MYEKKNKLSQPAPILDEISARLSDAVHRNLMKNAPFFFKTLIFNRCFGKYRLNVPFLDKIGGFLYFLEYALPTPPLRYCFLLFKVLSIYERFLSNNFGTKISRVTQHLWQIYLFE